MSVLETTPRPSLWQRLINATARLDDGILVRSVFFALLAGTSAVLFLDYQELRQDDAPAPGMPLQPILPAFDPNSPDAPPGPAVTTDPALLKAPLTITLGSGGILALTGSIDLGASARFAEDVGAHAEYIKTIALDSPGGSVTDAIAIGTLIREKGFATSVAAGALCASSCPLIFAGGTVRLATAASAIGVHQIYAMAPAGQILPGLSPPFTGGTANAMSDAQTTTAAITRYLSAMGIGSEVWLHALETPPDKLYYFAPDELLALKLATKLTK